MTTIKITRTNPGVPWGFRIHGGKDFGTPLVVLKVTASSLASQAGLSPGDTLLSINTAPTSQLTHKAAQDLIKNSANVVEFTVVKTTMNTWGPSVTPISGPVGGDQVWTKTSLARNQGGSGVNGINSRVKPFSKAGYVNKQFNTPINLYSDASIAETLSAQSEVLAGGAIGVNFKKNEKKYNYENSEVYKMLQQAENDGEGVEQAVNSPAMGRIVGGGSGGGEVKIPPVQLRPVAQQQQQQFQPQQQPPPPMTPITPVTAPTTTPQQQNNQPLPPGTNICADCERLIVGVFVRIKDKNLHVDCFKCSTCGQSLKNVGYYNINNKLYCDIHAKLVARQQNPGMVAGGFSPVATSAPVATPPIPPPKPFNYGQVAYQPMGSPGKFSGPMPFHHSPTTPTGLISHVTAPKSPTGQMPSNFQQSMQQSTQSSQQSNYFESVEKSSFSQESSGSKVIWPPVGGVEQIQQGQQVQGQKFKQQHVPYQPLSSLLMQQPLVGPGLGTPPTMAPTPRPVTQPLQNYSQNMGAGNNQQFGAKNYGAAPSTGLQNRSTNFGGGGKSASSSILANRIGRGILNQPSARVAVCGVCGKQIRGPFISTGATKFYCPSHFNCATCSRDLMDIGFVDLCPNLHCEFCWEANIAPPCGKCGRRIKNECLKAVGKEWHPECFTCRQCGKKFGKEPFFLEDGAAYCQADWNEMFTTKCYGCGFPIEAGDRWVEAMGQNYHSQCFNCSACKKNLEGQSFFAKQGRPFCKSHAR